MAFPQRREEDEEVRQSIRPRLSGDRGTNLSDANAPYGVHMQAALPTQQAGMASAVGPGIPRGANPADFYAKFPRPRRGLQYPTPPTPGQAAAAYAMPEAAPTARQRGLAAPTQVAAQPGQPGTAQPRRRVIAPPRPSTSPTDADLAQYGSGPSFVPGNQEPGGVNYGMGEDARSMARTMEMDAYTMEPEINTTGSLDELLSSAMRVVQYKSNQNRRRNTFKTLLDTHAGYDTARIAGQIRDREGARQSASNAQRLQAEETQDLRRESLDRDRLALDTQTQDRAHATGRVKMARDDEANRQKRFTETFTQILKTLKESAEIQGLTDEQVQEAAMQLTERAVGGAESRIADSRSRIAELRARLKNDGYADDEIETLVLSSGLN